jgi:hypothetical protein
VHLLAGVRGRERDQASELNPDEVVAIDDKSEIEKLFELDAIADTVDGHNPTASQDNS